jgi:Alternative complex III, ActD subunit
VANLGTTLLALYEDETQTYEAARALRASGMACEELSILSAHPFPEEVFPIHEPRVPLQWLTMAGGACGLLFGLFLTIGTSYLYPMKTGHMPILFSPPYAIIAYELMMLLAIVTTVGVFAAVMLWQRFVQKKTLYDPDIHADGVGLLVYCPDRERENAAREIITRTRPRTLRAAEGNHL